MPRSVVVVGAGIGGLAAAIALQTEGAQCTVLERAAAPGGKMREVELAGRRLDAGPTVLTMRWVFEQLFAECGADLDACLRLRPAEILARHAWSARERLDLFADVARSAAAIGELAGPSEARRFLRFSERARSVYETLAAPFLRAPRPSVLGLTAAVGPGDLWQIRPFSTLWGELGRHFHDPRLQQLFGRYATYCGSSPFLAPATLMLVAHVERDGVWLVEGGMHGLARALADLARARGATLRHGAEVAEVVVERGRARGVTLRSGERIDAAAVVVNADVAALARGLLGRGAAAAVAMRATTPRSLSAMTWNLVAEADGFPLVRHNVFFSADYPAEFADLRRRRVPGAPTVYVCAQDRGDAGVPAAPGPERLFCLVNAPPIGDSHRFGTKEIEQCQARTLGRLEASGLRIGNVEGVAATTPTDFERLFPGTGGALYGAASHGWRASFRRPGSRTRVPGLYLVGGSTHPGPGVPMAALSGRLGASSVLADWASTSRSRPAAISGGTSMR